MNSYHGRNPKIVIDMKEMIHFDTGRVHIALGGHFYLLTRYLKIFLQRLKQTGAELVFFHPAQEITDELELFIPLSERSYVQAIDILDKVTAHRADRIDSEELRIAPTFGYNALRLAEQLGELRVNYVRHNQEIAKYVKEHENDVLAILSNDFNFIVFEGDFQLWKVNELNMNQMTTVRICRKALFEGLGLNFGQMQLLATILGWNNSSPWTEETESHFFRMVTYVLEQQIDYSQREPRSAFDLDDICADVFGDTYTEYDKAAIENGFIQYSLDCEITNITLSPEMERIKAENPLMYQLIQDEVFIIRDFQYIDFRDSESASYTELLLPLLRKMLGILYANKKSRPRCRLVCAKHAHDEPFKVTDEIIAYPDCKSGTLYSF